MMSAADFVLIDLGNTAAKLRLARAGSLLGKTRRIPTATLLAPDGGAAALRETLAGWDYGRAVLSSVVPDAARAVAAVVPPERLLRVSATLDTGLDLRGYPGKQTLGQDRIADLAGAFDRHGPGPLIVVDFGTAATFNVLAAGGRFLGGVIAPGLAAVRDYLPSRAAQLPAVDLRRTPRQAIGRNTRAAILAGVAIGYRGLVREILDGLRAELGRGKRAQVIATGGDARWVARQLPGAFAAVDSDLTLHGLRVIAARQPPDGCRLVPRNAVSRG